MYKKKIKHNNILLWCPLLLPWPHHCHCRRHYIQNGLRRRRVPSNQSCVRAEDTIHVIIKQHIIMVSSMLTLATSEKNCRRQDIQEKKGGTEMRRKKRRNRDEREKKGHSRVALRPCIYTFTTCDHSHNVCHHCAVSQPACYKGCCPPDTTRRWTAIVWPP